VENADRLLDIWIKVLSQGEHTQRLLLDGKWQGSTEVFILRNNLIIRMQKRRRNCYVLNLKLQQLRRALLNSHAKKLLKPPKKQNSTPQRAQTQRHPHGVEEYSKTRCQ
jgi:hypothetical protein